MGGTSERECTKRKGRRAERTLKEETRILCCAVTSKLSPSAVSRGAARGFLGEEEEGDLEGLLVGFEGGEVTTQRGEKTLVGSCVGRPEGLLKGRRVW